jgi:hypothetical protein
MCCPLFLIIRLCIAGHPCELLNTGKEATATLMEGQSLCNEICVTLSSSMLAASHLVHRKLGYLASAPASKRTDPLSPPSPLVSDALRANMFL